VKPFGQPVEPHLYERTYVGDDDKKENPIGWAHELPHPFDDDDMDEKHLV